MAGGLPQGILQVKASYLALPDSFTMYSSVPKNIERSVRPIFPLNPLSERVIYSCWWDLAFWCSGQSYIRFSS